MGRLNNKVAFVTASGGAIAGATARLFGLEGAAVACIDIAEENVQKTLPQKGSIIYFSENCKTLIF